MQERTLFIPSLQQRTLFIPSLQHVHTESDQRCGMDSVWVGDKTMACIVKQRLVTSNLATHHRMSMTHCLPSSLLDLCASQNVYPSMYSSLAVKLSHLLSGEPLCLNVHFICTVFCARQNVVSKSDPQIIEKESLVNGLTWKCTLCLVWRLLLIAF